MLTDTCDTTLNAELSSRNDYRKKICTISNKHKTFNGVKHDSYKTAMFRRKASAPIKLILPELKGDVLDFGCGRGYDADKFGFWKYDKHYYPMTTSLHCKKFNSIVCNYVLNTVTFDEEVQILSEIKSMLAYKGNAYITVRRGRIKEGLTQIGTLQRLSYPFLESFYKCSSFEIYILTNNNKELSNE